MRKQVSRRTFRVFLWIIGVTLFLSAGTSEANSGRSPSFLFEVRDFRTGTLAARISDPQCADIDELVITGEALDGDDFAFIRKALLSLKVLNIRDTSQNEIPEHALQNTATLQEVILPSVLQQIGGAAFWGCVSLDRVVLPEGLVSIGGGAFADCQDLTRIACPENLKYIGYASFRNCTALREVLFPHTLVVINREAFQGCEALEEITLPESLEVIGNRAFHRCVSLKKIALSDVPVSNNNAESPRDDLMFLGNYAFYECTALISVDLPGKISMIGKLAFGKCEALKHVSLPKSLQKIMASAFWNCTSLEELSLPDGLVRIGKFAFQGCSNLTHLTLPESLKSMGFGAFANCTALVPPAMPPNLTFIGEKAFEHNLPLPLSPDVLSHDLNAIREKVKEQRAQPVDPIIPKMSRQHWSYDAIGQLSARGVFFGYPDCYKIPPAPRSKIFLEFAHGLLNINIFKASKQDVELLKALCVEFEEELEELGLKPELIDKRFAENGK